MPYSDENVEKEYQRQHYLKNKELYKQRANASRIEQRKKNKEYLKQYLQNNPCVDCGNNDIRVLQFDHRDPKLKSKSPGQLISSRGLMLKEIEKCDVRCANCHMIRTAEQFSWSRMPL